MLYVILVALSALAVIGMVMNAIKKDDLDEREETLDKYEISLDERANKLARWELELRGAGESWTRLGAVYVVTESDLMRFKTDKALRKAVKEKLAQNLAFEIVRVFELREDETEGERPSRRFTYSVIVKEAPGPILN